MTGLADMIQGACLRCKTRDAADAILWAVFLTGLGLLGCIFLSFGCLVAAFRSLASLSQAYDLESRRMAIAGFVGGLIISAFFGWATIVLLNMLTGAMDAFTR